MKNTKFGWIVFALFIGLAFTSCKPEDSDDVNQDRVYTVYELFYNSNTDKTVAVARFRFGNPTGTLLELKSPAYALFNGDTLRYNFFYSGHAEEYPGLVTGGTFSYANTDGAVFTNTVPAFDTIAFPPDFDTLNKTQAYDLVWQGSPLAANQNVGIFIGSWTWGDDAAFFTNSVGADHIVFGVNQMDDLALGTSTVYMDRTTEVTASDAPEAGGVIRGKYRAHNATIQVTE